MLLLGVQPEILRREGKNEGILEHGDATIISLLWKNLLETERTPPIHKYILAGLSDQ